MVKRALLWKISALCALFGSCSIALAAPRGWIEVKPTIQTVGANSGEVRDSKGRRYALKTEGSGDLMLWNGKKWDELPFHDGAWRPQSLASLGSGVVCVWNKSAPSSDDGELYRLSTHEGAQSRWLQHPQMRANFIKQTLYSPQFLKTGAAQLLLINNREFFYVAPDGKVMRLFALTPDKMQRLGPPDDYSEYTNKLRVLDDKRGGYWFWSNVWEHGEEAYSLRGLLRWDGRQLLHLTSLPGLPLTGLPLTKTAVNALERRDANHWWLALGEKGIYEVDCATLKSRRVAEPSPNAFRYVQQITPQGRDVFVVAFSAMHDPDADIDERIGQLWRLRDGKSQRLIDGLERQNTDGSARPIASAASGVWTSSGDGGVWLAPPRGAPVLLDWRRGFPVSSVSYLGAQKDGSMLVNGWGAKPFAARIVNLAALLAEKPTPRVSAFLSYLHFAQERSGRIWTILNLRGHALSQWDGARWIHYAVPRGYKLSDASELAFDRRHRIWILSDYRDGQTAILDPSAPGAAWSVFANYRLALQAQLGARPPAMPMFYHETEGGEQLPRQIPDFQNGRLCYRDLNDFLHYFDGKMWRRWTVRQIEPKPSPNEEELGQPFFNRAGTLCVWLPPHAWQLTARGWRMANEDEEDPRTTPQSTTASVPEGVFDQRQSGATAARDRDGYYYVAATGQLFRMTPDNVVPRLVAPLFEPGENQPFRDGRGFERAFFDRAGNVFFYRGNNEWVFLPASREVPDTKATVRAVAVDAFEIDCSTTATGSHWFIWRRDEGKWSAPQTSAKIELKELPGGTHRVEVAAIDRHLRRDATPSVVTFTVNLDATQQIAGFIADLSSPDYARREKAVQGLARQSQRALPILRLAREKADAETSWWIDAAIEAAENAK